MNQDLLRVTIYALVGLVAGALAASLALAAFFVLSALLDLTTPFQLMELSRPTHPLFRQLLLKAPGTYHHTLLVGNMAEAAAERIGADGLLTRVGTYYHDIGKTVRPYFFTENRVGGANPHERLDPRTSAQIIISHVQDGLDLAEKYRLPSAIRAFIPEHHGTSITLAFYRMAVAAANENGSDNHREVHEEDYSYPAPSPSPGKQPSSCWPMAARRGSAARNRHPSRRWRTSSPTRSGARWRRDNWMNRI